MSKNKNKRLFTIVDYPEKGETYGKYYADTPNNAAKKAFARLVKLHKLDDKKKIKF